jgi:hypothetical protein
MIFQINMLKNVTRSNKKLVFKTWISNKTIHKWRRIFARVFTAKEKYIIILYVYHEELTHTVHN